MIRVFETFAGYGSTCFALKELGIEHELIGFSEIDKYAIQCFEQNHKGKSFGDITKIDWSQIEDFDLLTGGFPCQSFSTAGKGLGEQDVRGVLGLELTRCLKEKQPKYFLFENVKGFMSKKFTDTREKFVKSWEQAGYVVSYKILNTKDFGIPQNRERVWFVGIRKDLYKFGCFSFPQPFELELKLKDVLEDEVDEKYFLRQEQVEKITNSSFVSRRDLLQKKDECSALRARDYKEPKCVKLNYSYCPKCGEKLHQSSELDEKFCYCGYSRHWFERYSGTPSKNELKELTSNFSDAQHIYSVQKDSMVFLNPNNFNGKNRVESNIATSILQPSGNNQSLVKSETIVRRLTPIECFRLQGFLSDQINLEGLSDTQCYKLAGNGQSINVVKLLLKELVK